MAKQNILTTEKYIKNVISRHGILFDYSKTEYIGSKYKIEVGCAQHGMYWVEAGSHYRKPVCPLCSRDQSNKNQRIMNADEYIIKANKVHNNYYKYPDLKYKNSRTKIDILCPNHGIFKQRTGVHLLGDGCPKCANEYRTNKQRMSIDEYLNRARRMHDDIYDYSNVVYTALSNKIEIICIKHGSFSQNAGSHINGSGCPVCDKGKTSSKSEKKWLDSKNIPEIYRNYPIKIKNNRTLYVDGYDPTTNTVYEFWGDFWHGNPRIFNQSDINTRTNISFGELYNNTLNKINILVKNGYKIIDIWEDEWKETII